MSSNMSNQHAQRVAANVRAELARQRVSQGAVAQALGTTRQAVSRRLVGLVPFDVAELHTVAALLGVPVGELHESAERTEAATA